MHNKCTAKIHATIDRDSSQPPPQATATLNLIEFISVPKRFSFEAFYTPLNANKITAGTQICLMAKQFVALSFN